MAPKKKADAPETGTPEVTPAAPIEASETPAPETPPEVAPEPPTPLVESEKEPEPAPEPHVPEKAVLDVLGDKLDELAERIEEKVEKVLSHPDFPTAEEFFHRWHGVKVK